MTSEPVQHFRDYGYVVVERFFTTDEIAAMLLELERLLSRLRSHCYSSEPVFNRFERYQADISLLAGGGLSENQSL